MSGGPARIAKIDATAIIPAKTANDSELSFFRRWAPPALANTTMSPVITSGITMARNAFVHRVPMAAAAVISELEE